MLPSEPELGTLWAQTRGSHETAPAYPTILISASAFSSQYVMSISRYIVVAVLRCSVSFR